MSPVQYTVVFFPKTGLHEHKKFSDVRDLDHEFRQAMTRYLVQEEKLCQPHDAADIGLVSAAPMFREVRTFAQSTPGNDLQVQGGIAKDGNLVISITGTKPHNYDHSVILRRNFQKEIIDKFRGATNVVANIEPKENDAIIDDAADRQAAKFGTTVQKGGHNLDVGGIEFGTIVLAAHGGSTEINGTILGEHLGQRTPEQIVALLTENADSRKHLSPKFHGLIILSGCFTAAGHEVVPVNYDYAPFAHQVYNLLLRKGYQNFKVQGMAGPSVTTPSGDKVVLPAADAAARDRAQEKADRKIAEVDEAERELKVLLERESKLETELDTWIKYYDEVTELVKDDPQSPDSKQMVADVTSQFSAIQQKYDAVKQERNQAQVQKADKEAKLLKRLEKLNKRLDELKTKYSADGVITFGGRVL